jgi:protein-tyrosine phosphatase
MDERWLAARFIDRCLQEGQKVLLHCREGRHRVRWAFVAYLIYSGKGVRGTLSHVADRPWLSPYRTDSESWEAFSEHVRDMRERQPL